MVFKSLITNTLAFGAILTGIQAAPLDAPLVPKKHIMPLFTNNTVSTSSPAAAKPIKYHGGPIMTKDIPLYNIFYGNWTPEQKKLLNNLATNIGHTPYYRIQKTYTDGKGKKAGQPHFAGSVDDDFSQGKSLTDESLITVLNTAFSKGLEVSADAIYFINTDPSVSVSSGFCTQYCGYHTYTPVNGQNIVFAFIGNPTSCLSGCSPNNVNVSPNNDPGVDAMASVWSHELVEVVSDPILNAWFDDDGKENADKCIYLYGTTTQTSNGAQTNMKVGDVDYLIQENWDADKQQCALSA